MPPTRPVTADPGEGRDGTCAIEECSVLAQPLARGEPVIGFQTGAVEPAVDPGATSAVKRHHERQGLGQVGGVAQQRAALVQRFADQRDVALGQIADTAVQQLGGARRGALGEIVGLE